MQKLHSSIQNGRCWEFAQKVRKKPEGTCALNAPTLIAYDGVTDVPSSSSAPSKTRVQFKEHPARQVPNLRHPMRFITAGVAAFYLYTDAPVSAETSRQLRALQLALSETRPLGVRDVVLGYRTILIEHNPAVSQARLQAWAEEVAASGLEPPPAQHHTVPVQYGLDADREALEEKLDLSWDDIVKLHRQPTYTVAFIGFTPGFPYLLGLPEALQLPRRDTPRQQVAAGSVAIAGAQAGIYPSSSAGGWWILGRTDAVLYTPGETPPTLLAPGDTVTFQPVDEWTAKATESEEREAGEGQPVLELTQSWQRSVSVQGAPHWGEGHYGVATGGALDPLAFSLANQIIGNPDDTPAVELIANPAALTLLAPTLLCVTGGGLRLFVNGREVKRWQQLEGEAGDVLELVPDPKLTGYTSYLSLRGGLRSTEVKTGYLQAGDVLVSAEHQGTQPRPHYGKPRYPQRVQVRVYRGPQFDERAFERLLGSSYRVDSLDRMGVRLKGPRLNLSEHDVVSEGSPWGAVQVPADGQPIILLSDRGRTGGYTKPAVCDVSDLWQLAQAKPGTEVWFVAG